MDYKESNKMIAKFMELTIEPRYLSFKTGRYYKHDADHCYADPITVHIKDGRAVDELKYNKAWDWLMPVLKKCRDIAEQWEFETPGRDKFEDLFYIDYAFWELMSNDIDSIYKRTIEFITWYNTIKDH